MKKILKSIFILTLIIIFVPIFAGCDSNRPSFPLQTNLPTNSSESNQTNNSPDSKDNPLTNVEDNEDNKDASDLNNNNQNNNSSDSNNSPATDFEDNFSTNNDEEESSDLNETDPENDNPPPNHFESTDENKNSDNKLTGYNKITMDNGIIISSKTLKNFENNFYVTTGSNIKIYLDLEESGISKIESINNEIFYYDETDGKLISALKINNQAIALNMLNSNILISTDTTISLVKSNLNLKSIIFCNKYSSGSSDTLYKKFNYISSNFRYSLISVNNQNLSIDNSVYYVTLNDYLDSTNQTTNVSNKIYFDKTLNSINAKIETFKETTEISMALLYADETGNFFLSSVIHINEFSLKNQTPSMTTLSLLGKNFTTLNIEFVKYYLI